MVKELTKRLKNSKYYSSNISLFEYDLKHLEFYEYVKAKCFHCNKYNVNWTCPPHINHINYEKIFSEFNNAIVLRFRIDTNSKDEYDRYRIDSTNILHKALLYLEKYLHSIDHYRALSFIGGSCKLCKNGCATDQCRDPYNARVPIEATGIDVIKSLKKIGLDISFEKDFNYKQMNRYGLLIW